MLDFKLIKKSTNADLSDVFDGGGQRLARRSSTNISDTVMRGVRLIETTADRIQKAFSDNRMLVAAVSNVLSHARDILENNMEYAGNLDEAAKEYLEPSMDVLFRTYYSISTDPLTQDQHALFRTIFSTHRDMIIS